MMTPTERADMITVLDRRLLSPADFVDRVAIPLLVQAEHSGAERGWDEGYEASGVDLESGLPNPYCGAR